MTQDWSPRGRFLRWSAHQTGCEFAKRLMLHGNNDKDGVEILREVVVPSGPAAESAELVTCTAHMARERKVVLVAVLPTFEDPQELLSLLDALNDLDEWTVERKTQLDVEWVALKWTGNEPRVPHVAMGFGPYYTMPETRRSANTAIVMYPGGFDNPLRPPKGRPAISLNDVPTGMDSERYGQALADSREAVACIVPNARQFYDMTFMLPRVWSPAPSPTRSQ